MLGTKVMLIKWDLLLAYFYFKIYHVPGATNQATDSLSCRPTVEPTFQVEMSLPERTVAVIAMNVKLRGEANGHK